MNILLSINDSYMKIAEVLVYSVLINNKDTDVTFFVFHNNINKENQQEMISRFNEYSNCHFLFYKINEDEENFKSLNKIGSSRWPKMVYYRLLAPFIIEQDIDRILYLDADMIVNGSLEELYNIEFHQNLVAMCEDTMVMDRVEFINRLNLPKYSLYYNSGMVLMNLKEIRNKYAKEDIYRTFDRYFERLLFPDQDILNIMFNELCITANYRKYNFICSYQREPKDFLQLHAQNAIIFHFAGGKYHKPWESNYLGDFFEVYWKYGVLVFGQEYRKKCKMSSRYLKLFHILEKRIDLFLEFHKKLGVDG